MQIFNLILLLITAAFAARTGESCSVEQCEPELECMKLNAETQICLPATCDFNEKAKVNEMKVVKRQGFAKDGEFCDQNTKCDPKWSFCFLSRCRPTMCSIMTDWLVALCRRIGCFDHIPVISSPIG